MRENSGKGDSHTGLFDPTIKEHEAEKGRSGEAALKEKEPTPGAGHSREALRKEKERGERQAHGGDLNPPQSDTAGAVRSPETGKPERH
jgi:hypothetical protein